MRVLGYAARRLLLALPVLFFALFLTFLLTRVVPGNPIDANATPYITQEQRDKLKHEAYLDRPYYVQFGLYLKDVVRGRFGTSYVSANSVKHEVLNRFPATFELVTYSMLLAMLAGVGLGVLAAVRRGSAVDHGANMLAIGGASVPIFWVALILLYLMYFRLGWFPGPVGRTGSISESYEPWSGILTLDSLVRGDWSLLWDGIRALALPVFTVTIAAMAPIARMTRASMIEALESDYVRTARSLGFPRRTVQWIALRNSLVPILTMAAAVYGFALGGVVVVESIFSWPGIAKFSFDAILASDFPAIQGFVILSVVVYMAIYLILDIVIAFLDPRVSY
jgi:peptide/nickel transport system permease protein